MAHVLLLLRCGGPQAYPVGVQEATSGSGAENPIGSVESEGEGMILTVLNTSDIDMPVESVKDTATSGEAA